MNAENMEVLAEFTKKFIEEKINNDNGIINSIAIDGGECVGTTTVSKQVVEMLKNKGIEADWSREPSLECKKEFINQMTYNNSLISPGEKAESIIKIFMKDRQNTQSKVTDSLLNICDRSILSTIIYQSGILDDNTPKEDIIRNCSLIEKYNKEYSIKLPKLIIVLASTEAQFGEEGFHTTRGEEFNDKYHFEKRLAKRTESGDIDGMDTIERYILVNNVYSTLMKKSCSFLNGKEIKVLFPMEFKNELFPLVNSISEFIKGQYFTKK